MDYLIHLAILCGIYMILAQGLNVSFGMGKLFNLAHVAAYSIGAYATAILATDYEIGFFGCMLATVLTTAFFALFVAGIALRLSDDYFAIGTLAFSFVVSALLINWKSLTRGVLGIPGIPRPIFWGFDMTNNSHFVILIWVFAILALCLVYIYRTSSFGRNLLMQSENVFATAALGINVLKVKTIAFVISSCLAGIAGMFFAYYLNYIDPSSFSLAEMVFVLTILIVGQPGSFWGVFFATLFLVLIPEPLRFIDLPTGILGPMRQLLFALILYLTVLTRKAQLFPVKRQV